MNTIRNFFAAGIAFYFGNEYRVPLHTIAWRLIWFLPIQLFRIFFIASVSICYGPEIGAMCWDRTQ